MYNYSTLKMELCESHVGLALHTLSRKISQVLHCDIKLIWGAHLIHTEPLSLALDLPLAVLLVQRWVPPYLQVLRLRSGLWWQGLIPSPLATSLSEQLQLIHLVFWDLCGSGLQMSAVIHWPNEVRRERIVLSHGPVIQVRLDEQKNHRIHAGLWMMWLIHKVRAQHANASSGSLACLLGILTLLAEEAVQLCGADDPTGDFVFLALLELFPKWPDCCIDQHCTICSCNCWRGNPRNLERGEWVLRRARGSNTNLRSCRRSLWPGRAKEVKEIPTQLSLLHLPLRPSGPNIPSE